MLASLVAGIICAPHVACVKRTTSPKDSRESHAATTDVERTSRKYLGESQMETIKRPVPELFRRFDQTGEIADLERALETLETLSPTSAGNPADVAAGIREKTHLYLEAFNVIDSKTIANFDFEARPPINSATPDDILPSGVDPSAFTDPELRARYEKTIAEDRRKLKVYGFQSDLRTTDSQTLEIFEEYVSHHYRKADEKTLDKLIEGTVHSKSRATSLRLRVSRLLR